MIPCKECLKYPVCKYKQVIECDDLLEWQRQFSNNLNSKEFPFLTALRGDGRYVSYFSLTGKEVKLSKEKTRPKTILKKGLKYIEGKIKKIQQS